MTSTVHQSTFLRWAIFVFCDTDFQTLTRTNLVARVNNRVNDRVNDRVSKKLFILKALTVDHRYTV